MIKRIYCFLLLLLSIISIYLAFNSTIIPDKIIYIFIIFNVVLLIITYILLSIKKKKQKKHKLTFLNFIGILISILILIVNIAIVLVYFKSNSFFTKITAIGYERANYSLIVLKDTNYEYINDIKTIGLYYNDLDDNYQEALNKINEKVKITENNYTNILLLVTDLINKKIDAIFINESYVDILTETKEDIKDYIKIIDTISIDSIVEDNNTDIDITKLKSFNIYISGIDTGGPITTISRSDVNIIATVNMKTNKILLTNTPRDYYVKLAGTSGELRDKLTHAGIYGIQTSLKTLEGLYDTQIDYYIRVNFNSLIKLVDSIGGIDVFSDQSFYGAYNIYFNYGWNHMDGQKALSYSRTRKVYASGDRHRGQNQQQVIEAIINKVTKSNNLIYYLNLVNALEDSFQTNIDKNSINSLINLQVKNNYQWTIESISVDGKGEYNYSYSYPDDYNYVMEPYPETVEAAKEKINAILNE